VDIKKDVLKELEICRKDKAIKSSLEAEITLYVADESAKKMLSDMGPETARFLQVAAVTIVPEKTAEMREYDKATVSVRKTSGKKCVRCWNYFETIGVDPAHPELCQRCTDIIKAKR
jgi:isoleucyl-tRNA synthetase